MSDGNLPDTKLAGANSTQGPLGLSEDDAQMRLKQDGYNELPRAGQRSAFAIVRDVLKEPMLALLLGGGVIYLLIGSLSEALTLLVFATLSVLITVVQEARTERVLDALRTLSSPRALVIRAGVRRRIPGREVVCGDIVVLSEGDRVPADIDLIETHDLLVDESLLTGESAPVRKKALDEVSQIAGRRPGGDDLPYAYSGSLVVRGGGLGAVSATGPRSEIGKIGETLRSLRPEPPRLQTQIRRLVRIFAGIAGAVSLLVVLLYGMMRGNWLEGILAAIAIGMSLIPEEFPVILTVFMAMGAWRISRARVLTRRAAAIETLGAATILCTDKTGTLTENRMTIAELRLGYGNGLAFKLSERPDTAPPVSFTPLVECGILGSAPIPFDPMERAFHDLGSRLHEPLYLRDTGHHIVREYGLRPDLLAMSNAWEMVGDPTFSFVATKGAPEAVARLCRASAEDLALLKQSVDDMGRSGMRVLGVARGQVSAGHLPDSQHGLALEFLGLVGLADPLRIGVPAAVAECRSAGIKVVMITGDYPATALAIANEAGIAASEVVTGSEIDALDQAGLGQKIAGAPVFARILPEQKLRIVNAFKARGEVVAMTGDGVNDAPSLKAAHIGIAMGGRGTDVAREAASIVLLDDDFGSIVKAIRLGRRIYDNLRKAMSFIIAVHVPIAGLALLPLLFGLPVLFGPMHIAFLEMVIDPVCTLAFESEVDERDVMRRPPRHPEATLFSRQVIGWSILQGLCVFLLTVGIYLFALERGMAENEVRAVTFASLVIGIVALILINRSFSTSLIRAIVRPNAALAYVLLGVTCLLGLTLFTPLGQEMFHLGPLHGDDLLLIISTTSILLVVLEGFKTWFAPAERS